MNAVTLLAGTSLPTPLPPPVGIYVPLPDFDTLIAVQGQDGAAAVGTAPADGALSTVTSPIPPDIADITAMLDRSADMLPTPRATPVKQPATLPICDERPPVRVNVDEPVAVASTEEGPQAPEPNLPAALPVPVAIEIDVAPAPTVPCDTVPLQKPALARASAPKEAADASADGDATDEPSAPVVATPVPPALALILTQSAPLPAVAAQFAAEPAAPVERSMRPARASAASAKPPVVVSSEPERGLPALKPPVVVSPPVEPASEAKPEKPEKTAARPDISARLPLGQSAPEPVRTVSFQTPTPIDAPAPVMMRQLDLARSDAWLDGLARDIAATASGGALKFALMPESLGRLDVEVRREDAGVHVHMAAHSEPARELLSAAQPRIAEEIRAHGVRVAGTEVTTGFSGERSAGTPHAGHFIEAAPLAVADDEEPTPTKLAADGRYA